MKISEGYNVAVKKYGQEIADRMKDVGMPKAFIDTACRFYVEDGVPIETLQDDFKKWNRYVLNNPSFTAKGNNNLNVFKTYLDFKRELQKAMMPFICPNPIYNDGNISIGELKTQRDARWFPIQNFAFPDENNDYCVSKKVGGYNQFQKYHQDGYKMLIIYDKSKSSNDEFKRVLVMAKNGELRFWNNFDIPCGTTKRLNDPIWAYIDTLPHKAQIALSEFAESTLETNDMINNKTNKNETKNMNRKNTIRLTESELKKVITESVKKILKENNESFDFRKELLRITQIYLRDLKGYAEGYRDVIDDDMELNDAIYQAIGSVCDLRDTLELGEPFRQGVSQGNLTFTDITGDI